MIVEITDNKKEKELLNFLISKEFQYKLISLYNRKLVLASGENEEQILLHFPEQKFFITGKKATLVSKEFKSEKTIIDVKGILIGGDESIVIAGPCSIENRDQIFSVAELLKQQNIKFIRGGAYKPRTSPYSFRGLQKEGLKMIREAADANDLRVVTEVIDLQVLDEVYEYADVLQVGSRNMSNFYLLNELGKINKPILLKRGMNARINEWLMAAEYILTGGNGEVILCERGIRTFEDQSRNTLDIAAFPIIKNLSHLPVISDPSHGTGDRNLVIPMSLASLAAGADGLMLEVHPHPAEALSDGKQSLYFSQLEELITKINTHNFSLDFSQKIY